MRKPCDRSATGGFRVRRKSRSRSPGASTDLVDQELSVVAHRVPDDDHGVVLRALEPDPRRVRGIRGDDVRAHRLHDPQRVFDRRAGTTANFSLASTAPATSPTAA